MGVRASLMQVGWSERETEEGKKGKMEKNQRVMGTMKERNEGIGGWLVAGQR